MQVTGFFVARLLQVQYLRAPGDRENSRHLMVHSRRLRPSNMIATVAGDQRATSTPTPNQLKTQDFSQFRTFDEMHFQMLQRKT